MPITQCRRLIACCMTFAALSPLAACGTSGGGLAFEPEHRTVVTADTQLPKRIVNGGFDYMWPQLVNT